MCHSKRLRWLAYMEHEITWMPPKEFWEYVEKRWKENPLAEEDGEFDMAMPMDKLRARVHHGAPTYTPVDDGDFAGPVERWYGVVDKRCFSLTYHYFSEHTVVVQYEKSQ